MHNNLGGILFRRGHILPAFIHFIEALRIAPYLSEPANNLAHGYQVHGSQPVISRFLSHLPEAYRKDANVHLALGRMYQRSDRPDLAMAHYRQALAIDPAHVVAARMLHRLENALKAD